MMEKKSLVILAVLNIVLITAITIGYFQVDDQPPVITAEGALIYTKETQESEILSILQAVDKKDGDVSDTLVIEKIIPCAEKNLVWITCGAKDKSNNIVKHTIAVSCDDTYFAKEAEKEEIFRLVAGEAENMLETSGTMPDEELLSENDLTDTDEPVEEEEPEDAIREDGDESDEEPDRAEQHRTDDSPQQETDESPKLVFSSGEVKTKKGYNPAWVTVISALLDDKDTYDTLLGTIKIEGNFDNSVPGSYDVSAYVTDSDGNESAHNPIRIIVEE